jgi:endonuclease G
VVITLQQVRAARREVWWAAARRWRERQGQRQESARRIAADGAGAADSAERRWKFAQREAVRTSALARLRDGTLPRALERMIGPTLDMSAAPPNEGARIAGRPVARIVVMPDRSDAPEAIATGFLITPRLLITNHHVLPSKSSAAGLGANFLHDQQTGRVQAGVFFELKPDDFYLSDETLDFALVAISAKAREGNSIEEFGAIPLIEATPKILIGQPVNIVQYPEGGVKQWAYTQNELLDVLDDGFLHYTTDTMRGSSGSPAFNQAWELVALHHAGVPEIRNGQIWSTRGQPWDAEKMDDDEVSWIANEGARVSAIVGRLAAQRPAQPAQQALLDQLLRATSDPLAAVASPAENLPVQIPGLSTQTNPMANNVFNFSGPVTIHVNGDSSATITPQTSPATPLAVEAVIRFDRNYDAKKGYQEKFLKLKVAMPTLKASRLGEILKGTDGKPLLLNYRHYSLVMNQARRLQMWSAVNVDYSPDKRGDKSRKELGTDKWIPDPRIPGQDQITDADFYKPAGQIDRGHIVRREDNAWGADEEEIEYSNSDTFHWTNCTPQHTAFNKEFPGKKYGRNGIWGEFEAYVQDQLLAGEKRCCILAGPVLAKNDPSKDFGAGPIQYPVKFWKVIAVVSGTGNKRKLNTYGFVFDQTDVVTTFGIEFTAGTFGRYQKKLSEISTLAGVGFDKSLLDADAKKSS